MPHLIVRNGTTSSVTYTLGGDELLHVESVSADIDATAAGAASNGDVIFRDASGFLIARSRSSPNILAGIPWLITWAPNLPDTQELNNAGIAPVVTTGLADTLVPPGGSITVSVTDAAAIVTQARLWVDNVSDVDGADDTGALDAGRWAYVPGPGS